MLKSRILLTKFLVGFLGPAQNVYYQPISQAEDEGSGDCIRKGKYKDDCGKDEVGEDDQTLPEFPKLLMLLWGRRRLLGQVFDGHQQEEDNEGEH